MICGTDPYPTNFRAKKYKIKDKFFSKADFQFMMRNLPVPVMEEEIDQMFEFADKDKDGKAVLSDNKLHEMIIAQVLQSAIFSERSLLFVLPQTPSLEKSAH